MVQIGDQTTTATTGTTTTVAQPACQHLLPCGVCRLLMCNCPKQTFTVTPTWNWNEVTCK